jgi:glycine/D-amino acid oxidase-like deaminating enzyme
MTHPSLPATCDIAVIGAGAAGLMAGIFAARAGRRVVVVDCDFGLGNAHLLLGVNPRFALHHLLSGAHPSRLGICVCMERERD